jgi:hypothetical protein
VFPVARRLWEKQPSPGDADSVRDYVSQANFRQDIHYIVQMCAGHAGTETWQGVH